jgi:hypothetical protein
MITRWTILNRDIFHLEFMIFVENKHCTMRSGLGGLPALVGVTLPSTGFTKGIQ